MLIIGLAADEYCVLSVTGLTSTFSGMQSAPSSCSASSTGLLVLVGALSLPVFSSSFDAPAPGRNTMSKTTTRIASTPSPTRSLRRQYTWGGWGPTGLRNVDMPQG